MPKVGLEDKRPEKVEVDQSLIECNLLDLMLIELIQVRRTPLEKIYKGLIEEYHYLRYTQVRQ